MTYKKSRARREFEVQIEQTRAELVQLHRQAIASGSSGARLLGAYYVFAFAQLEVYVRTIVEDGVQALLTAATKPGSLPDLMIGYVVHRSEDLGADYRKFATNEDEGALLEKVAAVVRKSADWEAGRQQLALDAKAFLEKKKYPSPKNMPQLFRRLGIKKLWAVLSAAGRFNAELTLTSLNDLRTAVAHDGAVPTGFGVRDFRDRLAKMESFVAVLDRCVAAHFCSASITRSVWNRSIS